MCSSDLIVLSQYTQQTTGPELSQPCGTQTPNTLPQKHTQTHTLIRPGPEHSSLLMETYSINLYGLREADLSLSHTHTQNLARRYVMDTPTNQPSFFLTKGPGSCAHYRQTDWLDYREGSPVIQPGAHPWALPCLAWEAEKPCHARVKTDTQKPLVNKEFILNLLYIYRNMKRL